MAVPRHDTRLSLRVVPRVLVCSGLKLQRLGHPCELVIRA